MKMCVALMRWMAIWAIAAEQITGRTAIAADPTGLTPEVSTVEATSTVAEPAPEAGTADIPALTVETVPGNDFATALAPAAEAAGYPSSLTLGQADADIEEPVSADYQIELLPRGDAFVPANRRSAIVLVGRILDADGNPVPLDVVVTLTTSAGEFLGADYDTDRSGFQVLARRGEFEVRLRSALEAQQVRVRASASGYAVRGLEPETTLRPLPDLEAYAELEFTTDLWPSLVAGVVDLRLGPGGTDYWGSFRDFLNPDQIGTTQFGFGAAIFAIGAIGEWQFTGAFNSDRALNETCNGNRLYRDVQFCEQRYPVYGDRSEIDRLTPSIDSFYVRFQRDATITGAEPDYFMWGDYSTTEFARASQSFTAINRQLHGFKGNYTLGNFQFTAMYGDNLRPFQRDTLVPDGTSGYYFLSRRLILPGSEDVFIEVEELNRPGTVIERRRLTRGADYELDYDRGALLFREPVRAVQVDPLGKTLVRRIVATYQVDGAGRGGNLYAARLQYNFQPGSDARGWTGFTVLAEDQGAQDFQLLGADISLPLGESGQLVGEVASSSFSLGSQEASGEAYRLELRGPVFSQNLVGSAYLRSATSGFSNTATTSFSPGQTRWGGSLDATLGPTTRLSFQVDQESNEGRAPEVLTDFEELLSPGQFARPGALLDNTLTTYRAGLSQQIGSVDVGLDWVNRNRRDRITNTDTTANQIVPRVAVPLSPTLSFQAQSELNLGSEVDPLYPTRTTLGLDWAVEPGVTVRLAQQFTSGGYQPRSITSLDTLVDYDLGENTSLRSRYSLIGGYGGLIGQSAIGLNHRIVLAPGLRANVGFERILSDSFTETGRGQQFAQPYATGLGASALGLQGGTAYSVGLEYTDNPAFQASARIEHRQSSAGNNTVLSAAAAGRITPALTALFRYQQANFSNQLITGNLGDSISLKLGMAYRNPVSDRFNGLFSYEFRRNPASTPNSILFGTGSGASDHTLALEGIYAPSWRWEFYGKYALRLSNVELADTLSVSNGIHLAQLRAAYRFAYRWDVLAETRFITQPAASYNEVGWALELGYYLTPDLRVGLGYSFGRANSDGFNGNDFRSASGPYLGIQLKVNELFNGFGLQQVAPAQQEESYTERATRRSGDEAAGDDAIGDAEPEVDADASPPSDGLTAPLPTPDSPGGEP